MSLFDLDQTCQIYVKYINSVIYLSLKEPRTSYQQKSLLYSLLTLLNEYLEQNKEIKQNGAEQENTAQK